MATRHREVFEATLEKLESRVSAAVTECHNGQLNSQGITVRAREAAMAAYDAADDACKSEATTDGTNGKPDTASDLLRKAAQMVGSVLDTLDTKCMSCASCRTRVSRNFDEARVYEQLVQTPDKLRRAADRLAAVQEKEGLQ